MCFTGILHDKQDKSEIWLYSGVLMIHGFTFFFKYNSTEYI